MSDEKPMLYTITDISQLAEMFDRMASNERSMLQGKHAQALNMARANTWRAAADIVRKTRIVSLDELLRSA